MTNTDVVDENSEVAVRDVACVSSVGHCRCRYSVLLVAKKLVTASLNRLPVGRKRPLRAAKVFESISSKVGLFIHACLLAAAGPPIT
jgi:hypothetical protein